MTDPKKEICRLYLDTSIWISIVSGQISSNLITLITQSIIYVSANTYLEIADICVRKNIPLTLLSEIQANSRIVEIKPIVAIKASKIKKQQRKLEPKFGIMDACHKACSDEVNALLLTQDKDFFGLNNVRII